MKYITEEEVRTLTGVDPKEDEAMRLQIEAAEAMVDEYMGRDLCAKAYSECIVPKEGCLEIVLKGFPVVGTPTMKDDAGSIDFYMIPCTGICVLKRPTRGIIAEYTAGLVEIPKNIGYAVVLVAQALRSSAENDGRTITSERLGDYQASYNVSSVQGTELASLSRAAAVLLDPYRRRNV